MKRTTIFLTTDGRHITLSRDDVFIGLTSYQASSLKQQGVKGFLAVVEGNYNGKKPLNVMMHHPLEGATVEQWPDAVAAYLAMRPSDDNAF